MYSRIGVDRGWEFTQVSDLNGNCAGDKYYPATQFPTVVQLDLLKHGLVPDPHYDQNEPKNLWAGEADWTYRTQNVPAIEIGKDERAVLVFEGLDTAVDVELNGKHILSAKDMFLEYRVDVTDILKAAKRESELVLKFKSAVKTARKERSRIGENSGGEHLNFGGTERLFLRKAQYHWGWDWGPVINTCGPWKPIYLEKYTARICDFQVVAKVPESLNKATVEVYGSLDGADTATIEVKDPKGQVVGTKEVTTDKDSKYSTQIEIKSPQLWYPHQYGEQPLYTASISLGDAGSHSLKKTFGVRRLRLLQNPLRNADGFSFTFEINNIEVFSGGTDWIPGDNYLPTMTPDRYEKWVKLAKAGNQTMIRNWGGGVFEEESFYDACDREGIIVWQDFLFACGNYPASKDFVELVRQEVVQQTKRVNHHPSLVLLCGNNEDYLLANRWGWDWDIDDEQGPWDKTNFPARWIYERTMPQVCEEVCPHIPYFRSSPYGGRYANDPTAGDTHIWDVWHGQMAPYQDYVKFISKFVSEFGFESPANIRLYNKYIRDPRERHSQSRTFDVHDKGPGYQRRYGMYLAENYRFRMDPLEDYIYCTQLLQAEAMFYAITRFRREFKGPEHNRCSGAVVWQLNDVWPGQSWAVVDYEMNPKPSFYSIKHALESTAIGVDRKVTKETGYILRTYLPEKAAGCVWAVTTNTSELEATVHLKAFNVETGKEVELDQPPKSVKLLPNRSVELIPDFKIPDPDNTVIAAYLHTKDSSEPLARYISWPEPFKYVRFHKSPTISITTQKDNLVISTDAPLKGVVLSVPPEEGDDATWEDNYLDLVPNEPVKVGTIGLDNRAISIKWLCDWESKPNIIYK